MTGGTPAPLLRLPKELLQSIGIYIIKEDLLKLANVCSQLTSIYQPLLFAHVYLSSPSRAQQLSQTISRKPPLANAIQSLTFHYNNEYCAEANATSLLPLLPNLNRFELSSGASKPDPPWADVEQTKEQADFLELFETPGQDGKQFLPKLEHCAFRYQDGSSPWNIEEKAHFFTRPGLKSLKLARAYILDDVHENFYEEQKDEHPELIPTELQELSLIWCQVEAKALRQLTMFPRHLTRFYFMNNLLDRRFQTEGYTSGYPEYFKALEPHKDTLEVVGFWTHAHLSSNDTVTVLKEAPRLRRFETNPALLCCQDDVDENDANLLRRRDQLIRRDTELVLHRWLRNGEGMLAKLWDVVPNGRDE